MNRISFFHSMSLFPPQYPSNWYQEININPKCEAYFSANNTFPFSLQFIRKTSKMKITLSEWSMKVYITILFFFYSKNIDDFKLINSDPLGTTQRGFNIHMFYYCLNLELRFLPEFCLVYSDFLNTGNAWQAVRINNTNSGKVGVGEEIKSTFRRNPQSLCSPDLR